MERTRDEVVDYLTVAIAAAGHSKRSASLALGLNHSYLSQFMRRNDYSPDVLPEDVRQALAKLLGIGEDLIKVGSSIDPKVNASAGNPVQSRAAMNVRPGRSTSEMRIDHVIEEIGRIKERLDRLEEKRDTPNPRTASNP